MLKLIPLISVSMLAACSAAKSETADAARESRSFSASGFESVTLAGSDDVRVVQGKDFAVSATGSAKVLDALDIRVEAGVLKIGRKRGAGWNFSWSGKGDHGAVVTVTMPVIRAATLSGSGDMQVASTAEDTFDGSIAGSGNLTIVDARAAQTQFSLAGSGDLSVAGAAKTVDLNLAGSGDIDAGKLDAETLSISVAGSGDVRARATGKADVSLIGSGDVDITGTKDCKVSKVGSGDVRCGG
jgi:Putative auto-transporter adhesin, head GIN domain